MGTQQPQSNPLGDIFAQLGIPVIPEAPLTTAPPTAAPQADVPASELVRAILKGAPGIDVAKVMADIGQTIVQETITEPAPRAITPAEPPSASVTELLGILGAKAKEFLAPLEERLSGLSASLRELSELVVRKTDPFLAPVTERLDKLEAAANTPSEWMNGVEQKLADLQKANGEQARLIDAQAKKIGELESELTEQARALLAGVPVDFGVRLKAIEDRLAATLEAKAQAPHEVKMFITGIDPEGLKPVLALLGVEKSAKPAAAPQSQPAKKHGGKDPENGSK